MTTSSKSEATPLSAAGESVPVYRKGQFLTERRSQSEGAFLVWETYDRHYQDGSVATRVKGFLITGAEGLGSHEREMDARSLAQMFPYLKWEPPVPEDHEDK